MRKQIGNADNRIGWIFTQCNLHACSVFFCHNTVQCQRHRNPLIFFDAAIVVRVQIREFFVFVQRILLDIDARRVNMCTQNIHAGGDRLFAHAQQREGFAHIIRVDLVPAD